VINLSKLVILCRQKSVIVSLLRNEQFYLPLFFQEEAGDGSQFRKGSGFYLAGKNDMLMKL